ncbi:unnamed protein product [Pleuronectes platessa]|uniref:Uncharacterized protein n=1 Tax=Pleuronectes platessa TaxID=8262 RepID=A0A9N7Y583_PLEPL|nr:unnamed protein product [Pleuronectes platessa]
MSRPATKREEEETASLPTTRCNNKDDNTEKLFSPWSCTGLWSWGESELSEEDVMWKLRCLRWHSGGLINLRHTGLSVLTVDQQQTELQRSAAADMKQGDRETAVEEG